MSELATVIDLDTERRKRWVAKIHHLREVGGIAVFGAIGEQNAIIIPLPVQEKPQ